MPVVSTVYSDSTAGLVRLWAQSWKARGWSPRLTFSRAVPGLVVDATLINFSLHPGERKISKRFKQRGWESAALVKFPKGSTASDVLGCGRVLMKRSVSL